jgi:hypothetical protein
MKAALLLPMVLAACVTVPELVKETEQLVTCANKQECDTYWQRAQVWIAKNSNYPIRMATDSVLSTTYAPIGLFGPPDPDPGYSLTKIPSIDGSGTIEVTLYCPIRCSYPDEVASLKRYITAGQ